MSAHLQILELGRSIETSGAKKIGRSSLTWPSPTTEGAGVVGQCGISVDLGMNESLRHSDVGMKVMMSNKYDTRIEDTGMTCEHAHDVVKLKDIRL